MKSTCHFSEAFVIGVRFLATYAHTLGLTKLHFPTTITQTWFDNRDNKHPLPSRYSAAL